MKCPNCGEELVYVAVYSTVMQKGYLEGDTNQINEYGKIESDPITEDIECPNCCASIINSIIET